MNKETLEAKKKELLQNREQLVMEANAKVAYLNGQIALIDELLKEQGEEDGKPDSGS